MTRVTPAMRALLDDAAGREHAEGGSVLRALESILTLAGVPELPVRPPEAQALPERPCGNERAHWQHPWFTAVEDERAQAVGIRSVWCWGRPARTAAFPDHRYVDVRRCYQSDDGGGPCRRMLVVEQSDGLADPGDALGWRLREWQDAGTGEREWRCPQHAGDPAANG